MKVKDIIQENSISFEPRLAKFVDEPLHTSHYKKGSKYIGSGIATTVYQKQNKPHEVKKITFKVKSLKGNYLVEFLKVLVKNQGNPILPKIYDVKVLKRDRGPDIPPMYSVYVESEVLIDGHMLNWKEISYLYRVYLEMTVQEALNKLGYPRGTNKSGAIGIFSSTFQELVDRVTGLDRIHNHYVIKGIEVKNELAIKAVEKLKETVENTPGIWNDLGTGNMMYRRTPYGVWPVLTDPFHQDQWRQDFAAQQEFEKQKN